jgi:phosphate:Na+ symporter
MVGLIVFTPLVLVFSKNIDALSLRLTPATLIAYFHLLFNVVTVVILVPFVKQVVKLSEIVVPETAAKG